MKEYESPAEAFADAGLMARLRAEAQSWSPAHASDLVSEATLHVLNVWPRFHTPTDTVIRVAAKHRMADVMRRERRYVEEPSEAAAVAERGSLEDLRQYLAALKPEHRLVLFLVYSWGFAQYEAARALGVSRAYAALLLDEAVQLLHTAPAWHNPRPDVFVAIRRDGDTWIRVAQVEARSRDAARKVLLPIAVGAEMIGSDMETETLGMAVTSRRNNTIGKGFRRTFRIPKFIAALVASKAEDLGIAQCDVYGAYLAVALTVPKHRRMIEARMAANTGKVVSHPSSDQTYFQVAFVNEDECTRVRTAASDLIQKFRPGGDMFFAYHVYQIAIWLCLQGDIIVPDTALERRR